MTDRHLALSRLLASTARAHHAETGGRNTTWPRWYAEHMGDELGEVLGVAADVETATEWLAAADDRYRKERPATPWPSAYATWIMEWAGAPER